MVARFPAATSRVWQTSPFMRGQGMSEMGRTVQPKGSGLVSSIASCGALAASREACWVEAQPVQSRPRTPTAIHVENDFIRLG